MGHPIPYAEMLTGDLRYYLGSRALCIHPVDVEAYLGKRVSIYKLTREELIKLHRLIDKDTSRGLGAK